MTPPPPTPPAYAPSTRGRKRRWPGGEGGGGARRLQQLGSFDIREGPRFIQSPSHGGRGGCWDKALQSFCSPGSLWGEQSSVYID